jgi:hypothetical protein
VLWLGEEIQIIVPEADIEGALGTLVATARGVFIISGHMGRASIERVIIPYSQLAEVIQHEDQQGTLELVFKEYGRDMWLRIADEDQVRQVYSHMRQALLQ